MTSRRCERREGQLESEEVLLLQPVPTGRSCARTQPESLSPGGFASEVPEKESAVEAVLPYLEAWELVGDVAAVSLLASHRE
jgi:hypothetical protein